MSFTVTALISAYNEQDVIGHVVDYLTGLGVRVHLLDDGSTDETVAVARAAARPGLLTVEPFAPPRPPRERAYCWEAILARKVELAASLPSDWFMHYDADEFRESPWPALDLCQGLARVDALGYSAVQFEVLNFWATRELEPGEDPRQAFTRFAPADPWDRVQIKAWRRQPQVELLQGGHEVSFPDRRVFPLSFVNRHYPLRGEVHGRRKVFQERLPRFLEAERARGWHVHYDRFQEAEGLLRDAAELLPYERERVCAELEERAWAEHERVGRGLAEQSAAYEVLEEARDELLGEHQALQARLAASAEEQARLAHALGRARTELASASHQVRHLTHHLGAIQASGSWRLTAPLRALLGAARGETRGGPS
tara:strand:+ start:692 stop:1798 length:1107 start_codon:yes stop_codon:yes gene_type:complete